MGFVRRVQLFIFHFVSFVLLSLVLLGRWDGKRTEDLIYYTDLTSSDGILNSVAVIRQFVRQLIYFIAILLSRYREMMAARSAAV